MRKKEALNRHDLITALDGLSNIYSKGVLELKRSLNQLIALVTQLKNNVSTIYQSNMDLYNQTIALTPAVNIDDYRNDPEIMQLVTKFMTFQGSFQSKLTNLARLNEILDRMLTENR